MAYAIKYLQDVQNSLEIRGSISEEINVNERKTKFFKDNSEWLVKTGLNLVKLRNLLEKKQEQKEIDY